MLKTFTLLCTLFFSGVLLTGLQAQTIITQWNFNSVPPDASNATGSTVASTGAGTLLNIGGTAASFASASASGGSSDPATADNTGLALTTFPAQGTANNTAGISFAASTAGYHDIIISYDLRHSNTGPRHEQLQYTADITATSPSWINFALDAGALGDTWFARSYNLSAITALNNNPNAGFRVVAAFDPATGTYAASNTASTYASSGTWRFDMVTIKGISGGSDVTAPAAQSFQVTSSTASFITFSEAVTQASATNTSNYGFNPALNITGITLSATGDTAFLTHAALTNGQPYTLSVSGIQDVAGNTMTPASFPAVYNNALPDLVITEIIHSPNDIESIEVYNAGATAINLGGLKWTDGTSGNFPEISLAAGATATFATSPSTASSALHVTPVYTILNGLGSSNDMLVIRNSLNQVVDSVSYFVGTNGWPAAPSGVYGYSFELNAAANDNNLGSNWFVPENPVTPQPTAGIIRATPGVYPTPVYTPTLANVTFTSTAVMVNETTSAVNIVARLTGGGSSPSSIDVELLPGGTATSGQDFTLPASLQFNWASNSSNVTDTLVVAINNDVLAENAEYFMLRFTNAVNVALPAASINFCTVTILDNDKQAPVAVPSLTLNHIASFGNGAAGTNSAEIVAHDPASQRLFIANSIGAKIDIVNFSNPSAATLISSISVAPYGNINSIAVKNGIVAAAIENAVPELPGKIVFFDINGNFISQVNAGAMPDMILFNSTGTKVFTANEGQPKTDYSVDPEGSVTIADISGGVASITQANVSTAGFVPFNGQLAALKAAGVRIFGANNPTVAQDLEPEYITLSADGLTAWVTCQENNAIAEIDVNTATVTAIRSLGTKDHILPRNGLDISDQGSTVAIANWPVKGLYMPDAIASYSVAGQTYLVTANEGDAREYDAYTEAVRAGASTYVLDAVKFPYPEALKASIGRLNVSTASGDTDGDGDYDEIHAFGARSVSIWNAATGELVWDSGDDIEQITSKHPVFGAIFNASNANNTLKNRSDDKGPEPEGVTVAQLSGRVFAFIALERIGGCLVYDITDPANPQYIDYKNTRTINTYGGDNGAEGIIFITAANSPTGTPVVILANEVSSTLTFFSVDNIVLDIRLADIKASNAGSRNKIDWRTGGEMAGDIFEVEKSSNGSSFTYLGTVAAQGRASSYTFYDEAPSEGVTYYRLRMKHLSGPVTYSNIVSAQLKAAYAGLQLYPNPATDNMVVKAATGVLLSRTADIIDGKGSIVKHVQLSNTITTVNVKTLPAGTYVLRYMADGIVKTVLFTKR